MGHLGINMVQWGKFVMMDPPGPLGTASCVDYLHMNMQVPTSGEVTVGHHPKKLGYVVEAFGDWMGKEVNGGKLHEGIWRGIGRVSACEIRIGHCIKGVIMKVNRG